MSPISAANQCHLSVPSVPPISANQRRLSGPITAASLAHISEGENYLQNCITKTKKKKSFFSSNFSVVFGLRKN
ncbi:unnamed protein product [Staurois parvus]|uniref:Uncharacterized protein n=1 Tax=Staurois parvus TaxID=386267 RepID=A0ABN9ECG8_9NEOB|nr:unnamed protein product [Staurois parvus]